MEKLLSLLFFSVGAVFVILAIKKYAPDYSVVISICASCMIIFFVITDIGEVVEFAKNILTQGNVNGQWINSIMKVTLISFVGQWGIGICKDAGENSIAEKLETAIKIMILLICLPYIKMLFSVATEIN